jgi:hypothetical protein
MRRRMAALRESLKVAPAKIASDYKRPAAREAGGTLIALEAMHANETSRKGTLQVMTR